MSAREAALASYRAADELLGAEPPGTEVEWEAFERNLTRGQRVLLWRALCLDCAMDTTPLDGSWEFYMVRDEVWAAADGPHRGYLCIGCLEARLGRRLTAGDFSGAPVNEPNPRMSARLTARLLGWKP